MTSAMPAQRFIITKMSYHKEIIGLIAQMVEHCTRIAKTSCPVQAWTLFFRLYFHNRLSCVYCCDDQSCLQSFEFRDIYAWLTGRRDWSLWDVTQQPLSQRPWERGRSHNAPLLQRNFFFSFFGRSVAWQPQKMLREWGRLRSDRKDYHSPPVLIHSLPPFPPTHPAGNFALKENGQRCLGSPIMKILRKQANIFYLLKFRFFRTFSSSVNPKAFFAGTFD